MCSGSSAASIHSALALAAEIDAARHNGIRRGVHPAAMEIKVKKEEKKNSQWRRRGMARYIASRVTYSCLHVSAQFSQGSSCIGLSTQYLEVHGSYPNVINKIKNSTTRGHSQSTKGGRRGARSGHTRTVTRWA